MLTESQVRALKPKEKDYSLSDDTRTRDGVRLILTVRKSGKKEWRRRTIIGGKRRFKQLGSYPDMGLEEAREALREPYRVDPVPSLLPASPEPAQALYGTLGGLLETYRQDLILRGRSSENELRKLAHGYVQRPFPDLWNKEARLVSSTDISRLLSWHIQRGVTTQTNRLRSWLHAAYQYALLADNDPRSSKEVHWGLSLNPVAQVPRQRDWERQSERVMAPEEVASAWTLLPEMRKRDILTVPVIQLCIATAGQRLRSLVRLRVEDVHLSRMLVDIPASAMKAGKPHVLPLTDRTAELLERLMHRSHQRGTRLLFPNRNDPMRTMSTDAPSSIISQMNKDNNRESWGFSDVRRTAKTVLGELGVSKEDRDRLHGHALHDVSSRHYDRYEYLREKREAMAVWDSWLTSVIEGGDSRTGI